MLTATRVFLVAAFAVTVIFASGCGYRHNLSPEMNSYARHSQQDKNQYALSIDHTSRQIEDDLAYIFFLDQPLRLVKYPVP